ncbi:hypothetical protein MRQ36_03700 [Micromonospora sp. R77]|uniref:hypothetical protein n=1 Tax=Micromonospora sp. R77 TaxID=2925836 RepID=UPI001F622CE4|nr:hypothetical protein [Micromonospora sp. R77]MCI4061727.1 hypothetical protein [Micromonospora sp. R77]
MPETTRRIRAGELLLLTREASPQFTVPIRVRVVRELTDRHPPYGWTWIEVYQLGRAGQAVAKRELFVLRDGLRRLPDPTPSAPARRRAGATR